MRDVHPSSWSILPPTPAAKPKGVISPLALAAVRRIDALFVGSDRGGQQAATLYSLIVTAKMNDIDPQAWLADVLARIADHPARDIDALLPWNWRPPASSRSQAA